MAAFVALVVVAGAGAAGSGTAPSYLTDVAHDNVQVDPALSSKLLQRWSVAHGDDVSYPLVVAGKVFVTASNYPSNGSTLFALDQADGHVVWSQPIPGTYWWSAAAYDAGRVFVVNFDGLLRAFSATTGVQAWVTQLPGQYAFSAAPTADNGVVYVSGAGSGGTLYAVDEASGGVLATAPVMNGDDSSPTLSSSSVFVSYACNQAYAFARSNLAPLWHYSTGCEGGGGETTVFADGRVFTHDYFGNLMLDPATGSLLGSWGTNADYGKAVDGDTLFVVTSTAGGTGTHLEARSVSSGGLLWSFAGDGRLGTWPPLVVHGATGSFVVVVSTAGTVYALDAANGAQLSATAGYPYAYPGHGGETLGVGAGQGLIVVPVSGRITAYFSDTTAPTITAPAYVTAHATASSGIAVSYSVTVSDPDSTFTSSCLPPSGSVFPVGTSTVSCAASDPSGNNSAVSFPVVVSAPGAICDLSRYPRQKGALNLKQANLSGCYLPGADFTKANATSADLSGAYLAAAKFTGANLTRANLRGAKVAGATFSGVTWSSTTCPDGTNSNLDGGTCTGHLG